VSNLVVDTVAEGQYAGGYFVGENGEPLV